MSTDTGQVTVMTPARTLVFATAAALAVGNLYLAQPLVEVIAASLGVPGPSAGILVTVTQIGYALGIFLVVPLGDSLDRRHLVPLVLTLSALALVGASLAPTFGVLLAALGAVGLSTVSAQLLTPLASELADPGRRGRVVGAVASGALVGILLSRTVAGVVADLLSWRAIYAVAALGAIVSAAALRAAIPPLGPRDRMPYPALLRSVFTTVAQHRAALPTLLVCASSFAVFSLFWTALTYLLTAPPFSYTVTQIGLVGLAGLAGALGARRAGVLHDRGWSVPATGTALGVLALSLAGAWAARDSILALLVVVVVLDIATQTVLVLGQTRLFALPGTARSRLNTAVVVSNFLGGAVGSVISGPLWAAGGWTAVVLAALTINLAGLLVWGAGRRRLADAT
ncbi:MFS transporter [Kineosporia succinea]|uniref:MFS family arabinose efflux permease n=1 Tax=Kineosporia succinea TaxID=84632 RepID=A0ABT9PC18_9ACTN|nr:MFS transporter [Kineosporia succinea]MDP9830248.1 putative MFS family arabinose efflux permease [Kineosporia succinea]